MGRDQKMFDMLQKVGEEPKRKRSYTTKEGGRVIILLKWENHRGLLKEVYLRPNYF